MTLIKTKIFVLICFERDLQWKTLKKNSDHLRKHKLKEVWI